jgi:hypothetical protein
MSQSVATAADTVREAYDAFGRGDIPGVLGMLADDVEWSVPEPLPHAVSTTGREGVGQFFGRLAELLGYDRKVNTLDYPVSPRGYRILGRIPRLPRLVVQNIVREFRGLDEILAATDPELESVDGVGEIRAKDIREGLRRLQEINLVDRYLQT